MIKNCIEISINKIQEGVDSYRANNKGKYPDYLIMNRNTLFLLDNSINFTRNSFYRNDSYCTFQGIDIAICDKLRLGEIDII